MKFIVLISILFLVTVSYAKKVNTDSLNKIPHIELMANGFEYRHYIQTHNLQKYFESSDIKINTDPIESAIKLGTRNLDWLIKINNKKISEGKPALSLSNPSNMTGSPITDPGKYSPDIIRSKMTSLLIESPSEMTAVLNSNSSIPDIVPVDEELYLKYALKFDKLYQSAARWKLILPHLSYYKAQKQNDIRGLYYLKNTENLFEKLLNFSQQDSATQESLKANLVGICFNTRNSLAACNKELISDISTGVILGFYGKYLEKSEKIYASFFDLKNPRPDAVWSLINPLKMAVPFKDPRNNDILSFLKVNIEDEWKTNDWNLVLDFLPEADIHMEFEPNATPHVNRIGGNTITMNENAPLSEWDVQWTIRHEFGHVLGFPDCYLEFYDEETSSMINYQIDISNLMCSRKGKFKDIHFNALKAAYLK